jgi:hypothetical protein
MGDNIRIVRCIGWGGDHDGCGYVGKISGATCPRCGGMLLSNTALDEAEKIIKRCEAPHEQ